jgi:hypothetical protein
MFVEWKKVRCEDEAKLDGINIDITKEDGVITVVTLTDRLNNSIRFNLRSFDGAMYIPKPPDRWCLKGMYFGLEFYEEYFSPDDAEARKEELSKASKTSIHDLDLEVCHVDS